MFGRLGWTEILVIVILLLILFGHKKIPGMMKDFADGINVFRREMKKNSGEKEQNTEVVAKKSVSGMRKAKKTVKKRVVKNKVKK